MTSTLDQLRAQNTRTVHLLLDSDEAHSVPFGTPGALTFELARVNARDIRQDILYAALGRDGLVRYATWYNAQAQQALARAQERARKPGDPPAFDDSTPEDAQWRAHSVAIEDVVTVALLGRGMIDPTYQEAQDILGPYAPALVLELVEWGRSAPLWKPLAPLPENAAPDQIRQAEENETSGKSSTGSSVPP